MLKNKISGCVVEVGVIVNQFFFPAAVLINQMLINIDERDVALMAVPCKFLIQGFSVGGAFFPGCQERVTEGLLPAQGLRGAEITGGNHVEYMDVIALFAQGFNIGGITVCGVTDQFIDRPSGLLVFVFDVNTDIHFAKDKYQVSVPEGAPDFIDLFIVSGQVEGGFAV